MAITTRLLTAFNRRVSLRLPLMRSFVDYRLTKGEKLARVDENRMQLRRASIQQSALDPTQKQLLDRVLGECSDSVRQTRENVCGPATLITLALACAWPVVVWFLVTLIRAIHNDLRSPSGTFFGSAFLIVPAAVVGVSIFRLLDMRWVELGYWIVAISYVVSIITLGATATGLDKGYIGAKMEAGMTAASAALLLSVLSFIVAGLHSYAPPRAFARAIRGGHPRPYIALLLVDVLLADLRARSEPLTPSHWKELREALHRAAGAIQTGLPYRLQRGHGPLDGLLMRECWRIAEALRSTEVELLPLATLARENRFQPQIVEFIRQARAGWWGDLPRWRESPSLWDKWSAPFAAALPTLLILLAAAGSSIYALVGWKAGSAFFNEQGRVIAMVFSAVSLLFAAARGAIARQRI